MKKLIALVLCMTISFVSIAETNYYFNIKTKDVDLRKYYDQNGFDKNGIHKETLTPYDLNGYNKDGYDQFGYNKNGISISGQLKPSLISIPYTIYKTGVNCDGSVQKGEFRVPFNITANTNSGCISYRYNYELKPNKKMHIQKVIIKNLKLKTNESNGTVVLNTCFSEIPILIATNVEKTYEFNVNKIIDNYYICNIYNNISVKLYANPYSNLSYTLEFY